MTPRDHNRTVGIAHGLAGALVLAGIALTAALKADGHLGQIGQELTWVLSALPLPALQLLTAYGLFKGKRWARLLALLFSALYVLVFPLGTLLAIYTWYVLHREDVKQLYSTP
jgi:uncharacterized membrane protein (DUF2068 family)